MKRETQKNLLHISFPLNDVEIACKQFRSENPEKQIMDGGELIHFLKDTAKLPIKALADENILTEEQLIPSKYNVTDLQIKVKPSKEKFTKN